MAEPAHPTAVAVDAPASAPAWLELWAAWVMATAASGAVVGALEQVRSCDNFLLFFGLTPVLSWGGALLGWTQWLVLRWHVKSGYSWIVATAIGWVVASVIQVGVEMTNASAWIGLDGSFLSQLGPEISAYPLGLLFGLSVGIAQSRVLRRTANGLWWLPTSVVGFVLPALALPRLAGAVNDVVQRGACASGGFWGGRPADGIALVTSAGSGSIVGAAGGAIVGAVTGGMLVWLLWRQPTVAASAQSVLARWAPGLALGVLLGVSLAAWWYPAVRAQARSVPCRYIGPEEIGRAVIFLDPHPGREMYIDLGASKQMACFELTAQGADGQWRWVQAAHVQGWVRESSVQIAP